MEISVYNTEGKVTGQLNLDESVFGVPMNTSVVHQAMLRQRANARVGTASTKTRSEVSGSNRKLYRQKGTGRARAGDLRSPLRRHGGVIFGPKPRSYHQAMPKKMRRLAIKCLLSSKVSDGELKVIDKLEMNDSKTKTMVSILSALGVERSALVALEKADKNAVKAASNITRIKAIQAELLNVLDLLSHNDLIMTTDAVKAVETLWGSKQAAAVEG